MQDYNPNDMSNEDLEKDMQQKHTENDLKGNQENIKKTTAAEGTLITPEQDPNNKAAINSDDQTRQSGEDGSLPDPEETSLVEEEDGYDDPDKFSG
jgi:hypothetical protein